MAMNGLGSHNFWRSLRDIFLGITKCHEEKIGTKSFRCTGGGNKGFNYEILEPSQTSTIEFFCENR